MMSVIKWIYIASVNISLLGIILSVWSATYNLKKNYSDLYEWDKCYKKKHSEDWGDIFSNILLIGVLCFCPLVHFAVIKMAVFEFEAFRDGVVETTVFKIKAKRQKERNRFKHVSVCEDIFL